ncbi:hypothetical protein Tco_0298985 [Tanacetum coccineum]
MELESTNSGPTAKLPILKLGEYEMWAMNSYNQAHCNVPQTEDLDAYNFDCDDVSSTKAVLMANLSSCNSDVLSEVPCTEYYQPELINDHVQEMQYFKQPYIDETTDNEITSDSNIILYPQYLLESQFVSIQDTNSSAQRDFLVMSLLKQMLNMAADLDKHNQENQLVNESLTAKLARYKERVKQFEER